MSDGIQGYFKLARWNWTQGRALVSNPGPNGWNGRLPAADEAMKFRDTPDTSAKTKTGQKVPRARKQADRGLDQWFTRKLHDLYDPVLSEKIPDDLSRLLDDFAKRPTDKSE
ncbi:MAG TPA: hypothetical protein PKA13_02135 [Geminicoccaceae bacterium]|nr:hypothetical protein [Geminicoccus sp.]HMU48543.1 hypothetical protein [Geminicoccaceae bacterium]